MNREKNLARLWRQIAQDYEEIRREQETLWASLTQEERIYLTEQLLLLSQEAERLEEQVYARNASTTAPRSE